MDEVVNVGVPLFQIRTTSKFLVFSVVLLELIFVSYHMFTVSGTRGHFWRLQVYGGRTDKVPQTLQLLPLKIQSFFLKLSSLEEISVNSTVQYTVRLFLLSETSTYIQYSTEQNRYFYLSVMYFINNPQLNCLLKDCVHMHCISVGKCDIGFMWIYRNLNIMK